MLRTSASCRRRLNDVFFAVHASLAGAVMLGQIAFYDKGSQTVSATCKYVMAALTVGLMTALGFSLWPAVPWEPLDFFYLLGYIKACISGEHAESSTHVEQSRIDVLPLSVVLAVQVVITVIKYMPQVPKFLMLPGSEAAPHASGLMQDLC